MQITKPKSESIVWAPQPGSQEAYLTCPLPEVLYEGTRGPGKGQPLDEPVLTPNGWRLMGELEVGDWVCTPDGKRALIDGIYPQDSIPCYKITFDDGTDARCDESHIWPIHVAGKQGKATNTPMAEVISLLNCGTAMYIPSVREVTFDAPAVRYDPYLFARMMFGAESYWGEAYINTRGIIDLENLRHYPGAEVEGGKVILPDTKWCGIDRIPPDLLMAPADQRWAFVQGMCDAIGYPEDYYILLKHVHNDMLRRDVLALLRSVGLKVRVLEESFDLMIARVTSNDGRLFFRIPRLNKGQ